MQKNSGANFRASHVLFRNRGTEPEHLEGTHAGAGRTCKSHAELGNETEAAAGTAEGSLLINTTLTSLLSNATQAVEMGLGNVRRRQVQTSRRTETRFFKSEVVVRPPSEAPVNAAIFFPLYVAQGFRHNENCCHPCTRAEGWDRLDPLAPPPPPTS